MPADLRTKLKALVEEWREEEKEERIQGSIMIAATLRACSKQLAALLAESEPEPDECPFPSPEHRGESGCPCNPIDGKCVYCGAPEPELLAAPTTDCEAKAKLPLGHEFVPHTNGPERDCTLYQKCHYIGGPGLCGQPRSAHEVKP